MSDEDEVPEFDMEEALRKAAEKWEKEQVGEAKPPMEEKLSKDEACQKLASSLVVFVQFGQVLYEEISEVRDVLRALCPGTPDYSKNLVPSKID